MIRDIVHDPIFLKQEAQEATKDDLHIATDLQDTLVANKQACVGMAANMIGINKAIIIVNMGFVNVVMFNPRILKMDSPYKAVEGCLSLIGQRETTRYKNIEIEYLDTNWQKKSMKLSGWTAQICQHEIDHLNGVII